MQLVPIVAFCFFMETSAQFLVRDLHLVIYKLQSCPNTKRLPVRFTNFKLNHDKDGFQVLDVDTIVKKDLPEKLRARLTMDKCKSRESPDTCMRYTSINTQHLCKILALPTTVLTDFLSKIQPHWTCPIKKGVYSCRNCSFDMNLFKMFPVQDAYWKVRSELLDPNHGTLLGCVLAETEIYRHH